MNWITEYISEGIIHALGMTFLHSIWLGILAAFFVSIAFYLFKEKRADIRYNISRGAMMVFFLAVCSVFTIYYEDTSDDALPTVELGVRLSETDLVSDSAMATETDLFGQVQSFLNQHAEALVLFWLIGIILLSIRFAGGFLYVRRLRTIGLSPVPDEWKSKMEAWGTKLGLKKLPSFHMSSLVTSPIAFGYIKPMVLFPLGMFTSMPVQHLDAMLMHELIHVKNADYITNLFLSVVEILLFFNPAVWWLSGVIRAEMEHRCDDMAVAMTGNKMSYAYALVAMQENEIFPKTELVLGMAKNKSQLTHRVNRLFGSKGEKSISYGRPIISFIVLISSVLLLAFNSPDETIVDAEEELDLTFMLIDSLSKEYTTDLLNKEETPLPASSLSVWETIELLTEGKTALVSEMNNSDDSFQNAYYYFNDKPVDKEAYYKKNEQPGGFSIGHVLDDSIELRLYSNKRLYDSLKGKAYNDGRISKKATEEKVLLVDGKERPMEFLDQLSQETDLGSIAVMTDKHAYDISPKYANKTVIVVRTKKGMKDNEYIKKEDSLRLVHYLRNETSIISERNTKNESLKFSEKKKTKLAKFEEVKGYSRSSYSNNLETPIHGLSVDNSDDRSKPVLSKYYGLVAQSMTKRHLVNFGYDSRTRMGYSLTKSIQDSTELSHNRIKEKPGLTLMHKTVGLNQSRTKASSTRTFIEGHGFIPGGYSAFDTIKSIGSRSRPGGRIAFSRSLNKSLQDSAKLPINGYSIEIDNYRDSLVHTTKMTRQGRTKTRTGGVKGSYKFNPTGNEFPLNSSILIRNKDSSRPLVIVDGKKRKNIEEIDPKTIESISVLKGKSATAVYEEEGKDGVILITTKSNRNMKLSADTEMNVEHSIVKRGNEFYLKGKVKGNVSKENLENVKVNFDGFVEKAITGKNGEFEILIPSGTQIATVSHKIGSYYIPIDREVVNTDSFISDLEKSLKVNPNPSAGIVKIQLENDEDQWVFINIMSVDMKKVIKNLQRKQLKKGVHQFQWNSKKATPGVYLVWVQSRKETFSKKLLIER